MFEPQLSIKKPADITTRSEVHICLCRLGKLPEVPYWNMFSCCMQWLSVFMLKLHLSLKHKCTIQWRYYYNKIKFNKRLFIYENNVGEWQKFKPVPAFILQVKYEPVATE